MSVTIGDVVAASTNTATVINFNGQPITAVAIYTDGLNVLPGGGSTPYTIAGLQALATAQNLPGTTAIVNASQVGTIYDATGTVLALNLQ